jgi:hypothetical protein
MPHYLMTCPNLIWYREMATSLAGKIAVDALNDQLIHRAVL